ncbi:signal peptidase I [Aeromicrobium sp.]|uniref:signal peptidase I n=1 Tax=Aeromicrobium sp. TaxID=1871063 RepID=UPI003C626699
MTRSRFLKLTREAALSLTAVVGAISVVVMLLSFAFGVHPLLFKSGSMEPTISTGDLSIARTIKAPELHIGDIVSVREPHQDRVTHRVVDVQGTGATRQVTLKGDANRVIDPAVYNVKDAERVLFTVPKAGYAVAWFSHAPGSFVLAAYVALLLLLIAQRSPTSNSGGFRSADEETGGGAGAPDSVTALDPPEGAAPVEPEPGRKVGAKGKRKRVGRDKAVATGSVLAFVAVSAIGWMQSTTAAWVDSAGVSNVTFSAAAQFDTTAPTTTVSQSPVANGAGWNNANVTLTFSPTDPAGGSGVQKVEFRTSLNGGALSAYTTLTVAPYTATISSEGTTVVEYRATDNAGNVETPNKSRTVKLDKTNPAATIAFPSANNDFNSATKWGTNCKNSGGTSIAGWCGTRTDSLSGVASITYEISKVVTSGGARSYWDAATSTFVASPVTGIPASSSVANGWVVPMAYGTTDANGIGKPFSARIILTITDVAGNVVTVTGTYSP